MTVVSGRLPLSPAAVAVLAALALLGVTQGPRAQVQDGWLPLDTPDLYAATVAAREVSLREGNVVFTSHPDGTFDGHIDGAAWEGTWTIRKGMVCYQGMQEGSGPTYGCARAFVSGDVLRLDFALDIATLYYDLGPRGE